MQGRRRGRTQKGALWLTAMFFLVVFPRDAGAISGITAKAVLVQRLDNGAIILSQSRNTRLPAASTVKVLTAVIVMERLGLDQEIVISKRAAGITPTKLYLAEGVRYKVRDLLKAFLIRSANDAGVALAEAISDTEIKFALLMNERAKQLGANDSFFLNATGLPEGKKRQYSTPHDLAVFMKEFSKYPFLMEIIGTKNAVISGSDGRKITVQSRNRLLGQQGNPLFGKTGYTIAARHCFLGIFNKGKHQYIVAVQGSAKLWDDLRVLMKRTGK